MSFINIQEKLSWMPKLSVCSSAGRLYDYKSLESVLNK